MPAPKLWRKARSRFRHTRCNALEKANPSRPLLAGVLGGARVLLVRQACDYQAVIVADHEMSSIEAGRDVRDVFATRQVYRIHKEQGAWTATAVPDVFCS